MRVIQPSLNFNLRNFSQKKAPIYAIVRYQVNGKIVQAKIPTGKTICPPYWKKRLQLAEGEKSIEINNTIFQFRMLFAEYMKGNPFFSISELKIKFATITNTQNMANKKPNPRQKTASKLFEKAFELHYDGAKETTYEVKKRQLKNIIKFLKEKGDSISKISQSGLNAFVDYLIAIGNGVQTTNNTAGLYALLINHVMCKKSEFGRYNFQPVVQNRLKDKRENADLKVRYLDTDEIQKMLNVQKILPKIESYYLDLFKMQLLTGVRQSDLPKIFNHDYIVEKFDETETYKIITQKKQTSAIIIATPEVKDLQNKYPNGIDEIRTYYYNTNLKRIARKAHLDKVEKFKNQIGEKVEEHTAKTHEIISSHWARHTFISQKILQGYDVKDVVYFVGHKDEEMIQKIYGAIAIEETKAREAAKAFAKMQNNKKQTETDTTATPSNNQEQAEQTEKAPSNSEFIDKLLEQQNTIIQQKKDIENAQKTIEQQRKQNIISDGFNNEEIKNLKEQNERLKQYNEFGLSKEEQKEIEEMFNSDLD